MRVVRERSELKGIAVSPGIVLGKAYLLDRKKVRPPEKIIDPEMVEAEVARFRAAIEESHRQLQELRAHYDQHNLGDYGYLVDVHLLMLGDRMIVHETERLVRESLYSPEWALWQVVQRIKKSFENLDDEYFRDRKNDVEHLGDRILANLAGHRHESIADIQGDVIVVAHDLSPMDTAQMDVQRVKGFVTDLGGRTSHTAILARSLNIPAVVGLETVTDAANGGDIIVVDGIAGIVVLNPSEPELAVFEERKQRYETYRRELESFAALPAVTRDGHKVRVAANIELLEEITSLRRYGAEGIGLYRTEFLYMNRQNPPDEEEHFATYRRVAESVRPFPVTIRTLDVGGDKVLSSIPVQEETNPALGLRSIRLCLKEKALFRTQLKGILRASATGNVRVMFPMVSGLNELQEALAILEEARTALRNEGQAFDPHLPVGIMIEVPSAAVTAELLAPHVDFFSIGTNDLIQYALAIDRVNEHVAYLYEPLHPAVLRLIRMTVEAGHRQGIRVAVCGEMAGDELYTPVLLGLGVDELSMHALSVPRIKRIINHASLAEARQLVEDVLRFGTAHEVHRAVDTYLRERYAGILDPLEQGPGFGTVH
ncbi:MAG: phosphoenolpyruvate--protein phosphotransferase [Deltaproteobacteria bacterium]|nr:phosphoenolpyruvate--protein phosphotransferase [Deltaproteobacteria bacterium]